MGKTGERERAGPSSFIWGQASPWTRGYLETRELDGKEAAQVEGLQAEARVAVAGVCRHTGIFHPVAINDFCT